MGKKKVIISGINMVDGGALSIMKSILAFAQEFNQEGIEFIALVGDVNLFDDIKGIELIEFKDSKSSWFKRMHYEYFYFSKLSKELKPYMWVSMHDITPNVHAEKQAVYCHNPAPFYKMKFRDIFFDYSIVLFRFFYSVFYKINLGKNDYIIVQQPWLARSILSWSSSKKTKAIIAKPNVEIDEIHIKDTSGKTDKIIFFYPSFPRVFKNFEILCEAAKLLNELTEIDFEIRMTIGGTENNYAKWVFDQYKDTKGLLFMGLLDKEKVYEEYAQCHCLLFPSKLETWGLPISEAKIFKKPMIVADLNYSKTTVGKYEKVKFFNPDSASELAEILLHFLKEKLVFDGNETPSYLNDEKHLVANDWNDLLKILCN